jgi:hypothetical protein
MRWLVVVLALVACGKHERAADEPTPLDKTSVYPVIVPAGYLPNGPVHKPLIPGLEVALVEQHDTGSAGGLARYLRTEDLGGLAVDDAYKLGLDNLEAAAKRQAIPIRGATNGSGKVEMVIWGTDFRAATAILLPGVAQMAQQQLGPGTLLAVIPHRDVLVLMNDGPNRDAAVKGVLDAEKDGAKPITPRVLRVLPSDQPFWIKPPVAWND